MEDEEEEWGGLPERTARPTRADGGERKRRYGTETVAAAAGVGGKFGSLTASAKEEERPDLAKFWPPSAPYIYTGLFVGAAGE